MQDSSPASFSPSFSCYTTDSLAAAAERVSREAISSETAGGFGGDLIEDGGWEIEFAAAVDESLRSDGRFQLADFNGDVDYQNLLGKSPPSDFEDPEKSSRLAAAMYCLWTLARSTPEKIKSRRFRNAMKRSYREGKKSLEFLNSNSTAQTTRSNRKFEKKSYESKMNKRRREYTEETRTIHDVFYHRKKKIDEEDKKRKSYLPYRQDLFGIFSVLSMGKPFASSKH